MDRQSEHDLTHRQAREHKKEEYKNSTPGRRLSSLHPAWYVVVGVILIGIAMLIWIGISMLIWIGITKLIWILLT